MFPFDDVSMWSDEQATVDDFYWYLIFDQEALRGRKPPPRLVW